MGTQPVYHITNLQAMCPANFSIWLTFNHNNIRQDHQQNSMALEHVYPTCPVYTKIHQCKATNLTRLAFNIYVKDRLLSCATRTLERISKNPLVEESITFTMLNFVLDHFPTPLSYYFSQRFQPLIIQILVQPGTLHSIKYSATLIRHCLVHNNNIKQGPTLHEHT